MPVINDFESIVNKRYHVSILFIKSLLEYIFIKNHLNWAPNFYADDIPPDCENPFTESIGIEVHRWMELIEARILKFYCLGQESSAVVEKQCELLRDSFQYEFRANKFYEYLALTIGLSMYYYESGSEEVADNTALYIARVLSMSSEYFRYEEHYIFDKLRNYANRGFYKSRKLKD